MDCRIRARIPHRWRRTGTLVAGACIVATSVAFAPVVAHAQGDSTLHWGAYDEYGGLSDEVDTPPVIGGLSDIVAIQSGNASGMALDASGHVWTWGLGLNGVLGQGVPGNELTNAVEVRGLPPITAIGEADDTDVAVSASGNVYGWGWNEAGQLCRGGTEMHVRPVELPLHDVIAVAGGGTHMLYLLADGTIEACGANLYGELGNGTLAGSATPVAVTGLPSGQVQGISAGPATSAALIDGVVWNWGKNDYGQLGDGTTQNSDVPVAAQLPSAVAQVYEGGDDRANGQSLALLANGQVYGWGNNGNGQLGTGSTATVVDTPVEVQVPSGVDITSVASGGAHSLALDSTGNVWAWGDDNAGQLGNGASTGDVLTPTIVMTGADMISATADTSVAHQG